MSGHIFWEESWNIFDPTRVIPYADHLAQSPDPVIGILAARKPVSVCDAGCGCGAYALKLARLGYAVSGFDISEKAVKITREFLSSAGFPSGDFHAADITSSGFASRQFDAVVSRDVVDHLPLQSGPAAVSELLRITRPGGCVILTLDPSDDEYESAPHTVTADGDYVFTAGKWNGMVFHPYSPDEIRSLASVIPVKTFASADSGTVVVFEKPAEQRG